MAIKFLLKRPIKKKLEETEKNQVYRFKSSSLKRLHDLDLETVKKELKSSNGEIGCRSEHGEVSVIEKD